jgi:RHS repeat-associated protein
MALGSGMAYDVANRMMGAGSTSAYSYNPFNRKVWSKADHSNPERLYLYSPNGELLGDFDTQEWDGFNTTLGEEYVYFAGRRLFRISWERGTPYAILTDRLGSARVDVGGASSYYPYGETRTGPGGLWATYTGTGNLKYAMNRWYSSQFGRFTTPDPYQASAGAANPQSWNRYAYVLGDPANLNDPTGLDPWAAIAGLIAQIWSVTGYAQGPQNVACYGCALATNQYYGLAAFSTYAVPAISRAVAAVQQSRETMSVRGSLIKLRRDIDENCLNFLKSGIAGGNTETFNQYYNQLPTFAAGTEDLSRTQYAGMNAVTRGTDVPFLITVNSVGAFFTTAMGVGYADRYDNEVKGLRPATTEAQYFILLHELAHYFQAAGFIQDDGKLLGSQKANNDLLWEKCNKTIRPGTTL